MKQKTHDTSGPDNSSADTSGDGVLKDLAAKAKSMAPALDTSTKGDPRRRGEITVKEVSVDRYFLGIDGDIWAEIDWSQGMNAWCIQDACGYCLSHVEHRHAFVANDGGKPSHQHPLNPTAAIEKTKQMIRDGSMPSPEDARAAFLKKHGMSYPHGKKMPV